MGLARVLVAVAVVTGAGLWPSSHGSGSAAAADGCGFVEVWSRTLPDGGTPVALSSPNIATLDGTPAVVVGDRSGHLYALSLATGKAIPGWPASTGGIPIDSTPSVAAAGLTTPPMTSFSWA